MSKSIYAPLGGVILRALGFGADGDEVTPVTTDTPLPVAASGNITTKFREAFETLDLSRWAIDTAPGDIVRLDGNAIAASYLVVSKSPWHPGSQTTLEAVLTFKPPIEMAIGLHTSQRIWGQEFAIELVDVENPLPAVADVEIAAISQATSTLTVDTVTVHGLAPGMSIGIRDCSDARANYPSIVVATTPSPTQFTATAGPNGTLVSQTIANPSGPKGFVFVRERLGRARNGMSEIFEQPSSVTASLYVRSESGDVLPSGTAGGNHGVTTATTASVQGLTSPYAYAFLPSSEFRFNLQADRIQFADQPVDTGAQLTNRLIRTQVCPNPERDYKFRLRANNSKALTVLGAKVLSIVKSGTTTGIFTTDRPHGLTTGDPILFYGSTDGSAAGFPNLASSTAVTVLSPTTFSAVIGTGTSGSAVGGVIAKVHGGNTAIGFVPINLVSAALSPLSDGTRQLVLNGATNWSSLVIGDLVNVEGVSAAAGGASLGVDGTWKVANVAATVLTLVPAEPGGVLPANFGPTNCGGAVIKRTDIRLSFVRIFNFERQRVEMLARPSGDSAAAAPVTVQNTAGVALQSSTANVGQVGHRSPDLIADVASAAIATTTTTSAITPTAGNSYEVNIPVTTVTGTNPTLDVVVEESDDSGTNWFPVYAFPRITAVGMYRSPQLPLTGNRVRYVQSVGGSSPSFTRAINRLQSSHPGRPIRQLIDRAVSLTTANAVTPALNVQNCDNLQLVVNIGAATTPPQLQLQGSDDNGATWYAIGSPLAAVANSTVRVTVPDVQAQLARAMVPTAGTGVTAGYVLIKGWGV
jgi:hypothetical protein